MRYLSLLFTFSVWYSVALLGQNESVKSDFLTLPNGQKISTQNLKSIEIDSIKKGLFPFVITQKWEEDHKKYVVRRDSILNAWVGKPIPDFDAKDTEGFTHSPHTYRGRVLVLHFWDFWYYSFQNEIPALNILTEKFRHEGVEVLSFVGMSLGEVEKEHLKKNPVSFPLVENSNKFSREFLNTFMRNPYVVIVDKNGIIRHIYTPEVLEVIRSNINEKVVAVKKPEYDFEAKILPLLKGM